VYAAAVLNIVPASSNPIYLLSTNTTSLNYSVTNNTNKPINSITVEPGYLVQGNTFQLGTVANTCAGITLTAGASCSFTVTIQPVSTGSITLTPRVCGYDNLICSVPVEPNRVAITSKLVYSVYIVNDGNNTISQCILNNDTTIGSCSVSDGNGTFNGPLGISVNASSTMAYISNLSDSTLSICSLLTDGTINQCSKTTANTAFSLPAGVMLNPAGTLLYVPNFLNSTVAICPVLANGNIGPCTIDNGGGSFQNLQAIRLNAAGTIAYVVNINTLAICPVKADGTFNACTVTNGNGTFLRPEGISFNAAETYAYVGNYTNNTVSICPIIAGGLFGVCTTSTGNGTFNFNLNLVIGLNMMNSNNVGYIPNDGSNTLSMCPIDTGTGLLGICTTTTGNGTFNKPTYVEFALTN
jgi:hypothetical protein